MHNEKEYGTKLRLLRILRTMMEQPGRYTKKELAERYQVNEDTIKNDFRALSDAGFVVEYDKRYRYSLVQEAPYKQLKDLLHFSEEDQELLHRAIDQIATHDKRGQRLKKKLASLYDFKRLGHQYLRKPYLNKIDLLQAGLDEKKQLWLLQYHSSNSNQVSDRLVEPFHLSVAEDTREAFDGEKNYIRHFRISRIGLLKSTGQDWQHEGKHVIMRTDPFRIVDNRQKNVHLRLKVGAYNELIERFPLAKSYIQEAGDDEYDFQCPVNHRFLGLTNFILGFHHQLIDVIEPDELLDHLRREVQKLHDKFWG